MRIGGAIAAGCSATLLGIGLARFAYSPLLPAMVQAGWLGGGAAGALGAANLAGYLGGALTATAIGRWLGPRRALRLAMALTALSFAFCAIRGSLLWFLPWRVLAGAGGAVLMVLAGPLVQQAVPLRMRGLAGGVTICGVGIGVVVGAVLVPALLVYGLSAAWLALFAVGLALAAITWPLWPAGVAPAAPTRSFDLGRLAGAPQLIATYGLAAIAATPHMIWLPDYIARGLGWSTAMAGLFWLVFGIGAVCGPPLFGGLADRLSTQAAIVLVLAAQVLSLVLALLGPHLALLLVSAFAAGLTALGITALTLTRSREVAGEGGAGLWSLCTATWAAAQTLAGFFLAWLYSLTGSHVPLFGAGLVAAAVALLLAALPRAVSYPRSSV